jgi:chromosome segregation ATPase
MADETTIAVVVSSLAGGLTLLNVGWNLVRALGQDGREATKEKIDAHNRRIDSLEHKVGVLERDEAEEKGHRLVDRVFKLETQNHQYESGLASIRTELRSSDDKLEQVLSGIESIREDLQDD